jgi:hypothetical protein
MEKAKKITGEQFTKYVEKNVGYRLYQSPGTGRALVTEIGTGRILRPASVADIRKWNKEWNKTAKKVFEHNESLK